MHDEKYNAAKEQMTKEIKAAILGFEAESLSSVNRVVIHERYLMNDDTVNNIIELNIHDRPIESSGVGKYWKD